MKIMNLHILKKMVGFAGFLLVACELIMATAIAQDGHISDEDKAYAAKVADVHFKLQKTLPFNMEDENMIVTDLYIRDEALYSHIMIGDVAYQGKSRRFFQIFHSSFGWRNEKRLPAISSHPETTAEIGIC